MAQQQKPRVAHLSGDIGKSDFEETEVEVRNFLMNKYRLGICILKSSPSNLK